MKKNSKRKSFSVDYRFEKFGEDFLVTTNHGSWDFLSKIELENLKNKKMKEGTSFFKKLEEKGIIINDKNKQKIISLLRERNIFLFQGTSLHIVIPTLRCNQKCIYCHASSKPLDKKNYDMDKKTAKATVDFIFQSPSKCIAIEFQGGEPLLNFKIVRYIVLYAKKLNKVYKKDLVFRLVSNFSFLDEKKIDFLIKNGVGICTSLDGPSFIHDKNRPLIGGRASHPLVEKRIKNLIKRYGEKKQDSFKVDALLTITKHSLNYPKEIVDEYIRLGFSEIHLRFLNNLGDAREVWKDISYSSDQFIAFWKRALDYILELNKKGIFFREWSSFVILKKILEKKDPNYLELRSPCGAVIGQLSYTPQGDIFSCDEARMVCEDLFCLGNVKQHTYKEILSSNQSCSLIFSSINDGQICDYCVYKPYCGICPVCNFVEQGSIIAKIPQTIRCKIYKEQFTYIFNKIREPENRKVFFSWIGKH